MKWLAAAALILLTPLACGAGEFRSVDVESLRITIDSEWGTRTAPGYVPIRFEITNLGDPRVIDIAGEAMRYLRIMRVSSSWARAHILQTVRLARGDRVRLTVPVPVYAESENIRFEIQEDGRTLQRFSFTGFPSATPADRSSALIVADPKSPFGAIAVKLPRTGVPFTAGARLMIGPSTASSVPSPDFILDPGRLPTNWLGYTSLRAVVIGRDEWGALDDAQKGALLTWTAAGGDLIVAGDEPIALEGGGHHAPAADARGAARAYFFGRIHRRSPASIGDAGLAAVLEQAEKLQDAQLGLPVSRTLSWNTIGPKGFRIPIPGVNGVPTRAYLSILVLFALLIGPVNYWFLWRQRRLVLFVLTAPAVSLLFIVLLAGYVVAAEGFHVSGRAATFTMLDQARKQAVTRSSASLYAAGMTPGGGLRFPRDVAVFALGPDGAGSREDATLDLTELQQYSSGIIQARAPANLEAIAFRPARERLTFASDGGGVRVVNGLGATVQRLVLRLGGRLYALDAPLADGGSSVLKPGGVNAQAFVPRDVPMPPKYLRLFEAQPEGSYLAVIDRSPFWDPGVRDVVERGSFHLVLGWPEGQP